MQRVLFTVCFALLLSACSSLQISENDINEKAQDWIAQGQRITLGKSPLLPSLIPENAHFSISAERISLNIKATLEMRSLLGRRAIASGFVAMSGVPFIDTESGKIFIKQYDIEHVEMQAPNGRAWSVKGSMFDSFKRNVVNYVEKMPVYDINNDEKLSGVILSQVKTIELKSGHIILVMK